MKKDYAETKRPKKRNNKAEMSWHMQFESNMSITGVNADHRVPCTPAEQKILVYLHDRIRGFSSSTSLPAQLEKQVKKAANRLLNSGNNAVVVSGIDDEVAQSAVLEINSLLNSKAFQPEQPKFIRQGNSSKVNSAIDDIINGNASGLITFGLNPVFTTFKGAELNEAIKNLEFSLAFTSKTNETSNVSKFVAATPHFLESWGDFELKTGYFTLSQPTIRPLFNTQQFQDILLKLSGKTFKYYDAIKEHWNSIF